MEKATSFPKKLEHGNVGPEIKELGENRTVITTVIERPKVGTVKSPTEKKQQIENQTAYQPHSGDSLPPSYQRDTYDYKKLMPTLVPAEDFDSLGGSHLKVAMIRHPKHSDDVVSEQTKQEIAPRIENMIQDLGIDDDTEVYILSSPSGNFIAGSEPGETKKISRTETTADVIKGILKDNNISFRESIDDSTDIAVKNAFSEFPISNTQRLIKANKEIRENMRAKKEGRESPFPDMPDMDSTVYASYADLQKLETKIGIGEVSSATVARGLSGFDAMEHHFLKKESAVTPKKIVVIVAGHGQFITDITEALSAASDGTHPIVIAGYAGYWIMGAKKTDSGKIIEKYKLETGERTGMILPKK